MRFLDRLRQLGYAEGKNLTVDRYAADGQPERYANIARNVVRSAPDAIVIAASHPLIFQLAKETSTIPIVAVMGICFGRATSRCRAVRVGVCRRCRGPWRARSSALTSCADSASPPSTWASQLSGGQPARGGARARCAARAVGSRARFRYVGYSGDRRLLQNA
jgi:hypothetical protein